MGRRAAAAAWVVGVVILSGSVAAAGPKTKGSAQAQTQVIKLWPETEKLIEVSRWATTTVSRTDVVELHGMGEGLIRLTGKRAGSATLTVVNGATKTEYRVVVQQERGTVDEE